MGGVIFSANPVSTGTGTGTGGGTGSTGTGTGGGTGGGSTSTVTGVGNGGGALPPNIIEGIAVSSLQSIAGQAAILANLQLANVIQNNNLAQQNAVSYQQTLNGIQASALGKAVNMLTTVQPIEAASVTQLFSGNDVAGQLAALKAVLASMGK